MAEVDFSHARIQPYTDTTFLPSWTRLNPTALSNVALDQRNLLDISGTTISSATVTKIKDAQKQIVYQYSGTFTASGTEFYLLPAWGGTYITGWKVSNISFSAGDTYQFSIKADLICQ